MPTRRHEAPIEMLRDSPEFVVDLLRCAELPIVPGVKVEFLSERATLMELNIDQVIRLTYPDGTAELVAFEVQRGRDRNKPLTWPVYVAELRRLHDLPVTLIVWCEEDSVAEWARQPIRLGRCGVITPLVLSPRDFPDTEEGEDVSFGVMFMSLLMHQHDPDIRDRLTAIVRRLDALDREAAATHTRHLAKYLDKQALDILGGIMKTMEYGYRNEFFEQIRREGEAKGLAEGEAKGIAEGKLKGKIETLLAMLDQRGLEVDESSAKWIRDCDSPEAVDEWILRAMTATTVDDILRPSAHP